MFFFFMTVVAYMKLPEFYYSNNSNCYEYGIFVETIISMKHFFQGDSIVMLCF